MLSLNNTSVEELPSSISEQIDHLDRLFSSQELEIAQMDIQSLKTELKLKTEKIKEMQTKLDIETNLVSKLELERDLADAESKLIREQIADILQSHSSQQSRKEVSEDPFRYVLAHQFVPFPSYSSSCSSSPDDYQDDICTQLLEGWQHQEKLHNLVLKKLKLGLLSTGQEEGEDPKHCSMFNPPRRRKFWKRVFVVLFCSQRRFRKEKLLQPSRYHKYGRFTNYYRPIQDHETIKRDDENDDMKDDEGNDDDDVTAFTCDDTTTHCDTIAESSQNISSWLIQELISSDESNRKCIEKVQKLIDMQAAKIQNLEYELRRLLYVSTADANSDHSCVSTASCNEP
jgi:hypothetical protein